MLELEDSERQLAAQIEQAIALDKSLHHEEQSANAAKTEASMWQEEAHGMYFSIQNMEQQNKELVCEEMMHAEEVAEASNAQSEALFKLQEVEREREEMQIMMKHELVRKHMMYAEEVAEASNA